jgi:hypothetical protein
MVNTEFYKNGKIYKIIDNTTGNIYIGCTCKKLCQRIAGHRTAYKNYLNGTGHYITSFEILKNDNYSIILLEVYSCDTKEQLNRKEREYIDNLECVNKYIPTRTHKEYYKKYYEANKDTLNENKKIYRENNKDKIKETKKIYNENNKDKIKENQKIYRENNKDKIKENQKIYNENNKDKIKETKKLYRANNKDKIKETKKIYYEANKNAIKNSNDANCDELQQLEEI